MTTDDELIKYLLGHNNPYLDTASNRIRDLKIELNQSLASAQRLKGVVTKRNNHLKKTDTGEDVNTKASKVLKANAAKKLHFSELYALDVAIKIHDKRKQL